MRPAGRRPHRRMPVRPSSRQVISPRHCAAEIPPPQRNLHLSRVFFHSVEQVPARVSLGRIFSTIRSMTQLGKISVNACSRPGELSSQETGGEANHAGRAAATPRPRTGSGAEQADGPLPRPRPYRALNQLFTLPGYRRRRWNRRRLGDVRDASSSPSVRWPSEVKKGLMAGAETGQCVLRCGGGVENAPGGERWRGYSRCAGGWVGSGGAPLLRRASHTHATSGMRKARNADVHERRGKPARRIGEASAPSPPLFTKSSLFRDILAGGGTGAGSGIFGPHLLHHPHHGTAWSRKG